MSADQEKVADKIRRLLALSESDNPHEAALAAAKAQDLILKYAVSQEQIRASGGATDDGPIEKESFGDYRGRIPDWHVALCSAMERSFMCSTFYTPGRRLWVVGRASARMAFVATHHHLVAQIVHMADGGWTKEREQMEDLEPRGMGGYAQRWKRSFAHGAIQTIRERLSEDIKRLEAASEVADAGEEVRQTAIVLRDRHQEAKQWVSANLSLGGGRRSAPLGSSGGLAAGRAAGRIIDLQRRSGRALGGSR